MTSSNKIITVSGIMFVLFAVSSAAFATTFGIESGDEPTWWSDPGVIYFDDEPNLFDATQTYSLSNAIDTKVFVAFYYTRTDSQSLAWGDRFESGFDWTGSPSSYHSYDGNWGDPGAVFTYDGQEYEYVWRSVVITGNPGDLSVIMKNMPDYPDSLITEYHIGILQTPIPIPGAVWLLGSGLIGLAGFRRRFAR